MIDIDPAWLGPVLEGYEVAFRDVEHEQSIRCPLGTHDDNHPSASLHLGKGLWHCHTCDRGGDAIEIIKERENVTFSEAVSRASAGMDGSERAVRSSHDTGGGILAHRPRDRKASGTWRFTWGSAE